MSGKRVLRIILGIILLVIFVAYLYMNYKSNSAIPEADSAGDKQDIEAYAPSQSAAPETSPLVTPEPTPESTPEPTPNPYPVVDLNSWELILVNLNNPIGDYAPQTETLEGQPLDNRIIEPMKEFVAAARAEGLSVYLSSGYRDYNTQTYLYNRKVAQYGEEKAKSIVAPPGTSEHQTGLACDITEYYIDGKDESLENTELFKWMSAHCHEYGFIVRYPKDKTEVTGIMYEPWHFRYVGVEAATYIMENGLCLEEFVELYN